MTYLTGEYTVTGAGGQSLEDKWKAQFATLHGVLTHGFPNMVLVGHMRDGGGCTNANFPFTHQAVYAAALIIKVMDRGPSSFDVTPEDDARRRSTMRETAPPNNESLAQVPTEHL